MTVPCAWAQTVPDKKELLRKSGPIEIVSDRMEAFQEKHTIVFSGNAVATRGDITLKTDRLAIFYKPSGPAKEKTGRPDAAVAGDLERIELKGNVVITQNDLSATGEEAVYHAQDAKVIMTGNPVLKQGKNLIKGCRVVIFIDENRGRVEQCDAGGKERVTAIIHPQEKKD
ncbi:MAG: lipopolysaccharide transport periplasmic protein LptA [Smithellaceae bacterium]|nr:lipopolysaccharide transport periplasmic protein LptA [Syntrophaceae bacterium]MDD4240808.1 lipopolysaccharide transport periplasmic protein LptA [Smithellaceae bacterium]NLX51739.1 lipopolysaccharide transport periplasmic protein LptA [Deltaproteobacteria bacterium]